MKTYSEKELIIQQYRKVRGYAAPEESSEIKELNNKINEMQAKRDKLKNNKYSEYCKETEKNILDFLNGKMKVLE